MRPLKKYAWFRSLAFAIVAILIFKLLFVLVLRLGLLGEKQTKGITMQLPVPTVAKQLLSTPTQ